MANISSKCVSKILFRDLVRRKSELYAWKTADFILIYLQEEVRLEAKSLSRTLLPTHLLAVALCWNEALMKAPMSERVGITSFLIELHSHFPEWQRMSLSTVRTYPLLSFCFVHP